MTRIRLPVWTGLLPRIARPSWQAALWGTMRSARLFPSSQRFWGKTISNYKYMLLVVSIFLPSRFLRLIPSLCFGLFSSHTSFFFLLFVGSWWEWGKGVLVSVTWQLLLLLLKSLAPCQQHPDLAGLQAGNIHTMMHFEKFSNRSCDSYTFLRGWIKILRVKDGLVTGTQFAFENWVPHSCPCFSLASEIWKLNP